MSSKGPARLVLQPTASGIVSQTATSTTKNGSYAHSFELGGARYSLFAEDPLHPLIDGETVRFSYRQAQKKVGRYVRTYRNVIPESLEIVSESRDAGAGIVYVLSNVSMPGLIKIGFTSGTSVDRAAQLSATTGVPTSFKVEWDLSVPRNPRAIEQRAHAILRKHREGKEFFRASVEDGRRAIEQAFFISDPEAAANHTMMDADPAELERKRGERLAALEAAAEARERRRIEAEERRQFERSPEGRFLHSGKIILKLSDFDPDQPRGRASFIERLRGKSHPHSIDIHAELLPLIGSWGSTLWSVRKEVWKDGVRTTTNDSLPSADAVISEFRSILDSHPKPNCRMLISIPNNLLQESVALADAPDNSIIMPIDRAQEFIGKLRWREDVLSQSS